MRNLCKYISTRGWLLYPFVVVVILMSIGVIAITAPYSLYVLFFLCSFVIVSILGQIIKDSCNE